VPTESKYGSKTSNAIQLYKACQILGDILAWWYALIPLEMHHGVGWNRSWAKYTMIRTDYQLRNEITFYRFSRI
jgi:hypothetical protein